MLFFAGKAQALNYVYNTNQDYFGVNDAATPGLDTGSIMSTATRSLQGYGGIRLQVTGAPKTPLLNGVLMRGFGLTYDGSNSFSSHRAVSLGGVAVTRSVSVNQEKNYARFFDTFTNESRSPLTVDVDFGGQLGFNLTTSSSGSHQSATFATSSGDTTVSTADSWVANDTPSEPGVIASASQFGTSATVLGSAGSAFTQTSDFLTDPFNKPLQTSGDEANFYGYINHFVLQPGQTRSVVHFVVTGLSEKTNAPNTPAGAAAGTNVPALGSQKEAVKTVGHRTRRDARPERPHHRPALLDRQLDRSLDQSVQTDLQRRRMHAESLRPTRPRRWSNSLNRRPTRPTTWSASRSPRSSPRCRAAKPRRPRS